MKVYKSDQAAYFDVDDTLVIWQYPPNTDETKLVEFKNGEFSQYLLPHQKHIEVLKEFKIRGQMVVVWSQGGHAWAETVVRTLGLEPYVDLVLCKPKWYFDDLPCEEWMGKRYYEEQL